MPTVLNFFILHFSWHLLITDQQKWVYLLFTKVFAKKNGWYSLAPLSSSPPSSSPAPRSSPCPSWSWSKYKNTQNAEICPSWSWSKYRITQNTKILTKAQRTQGLSALFKVTAFKSYYKLIKIQHENLDQNSAPKYRPNFNHHWWLTPTMPK